MIVVRSLIFHVLAYGSGITFGALSVFCWILPARHRYKPMLWWIRGALWCLRWSCGVKVEVINYNDGPLPKPAVIMAKHQSTWETWFLQVYFPGLCTILKRELLMLPFFGWGLALFRPITIDRKDPLNALRQVKLQGLDRIKSGRNVLVFPEGTRMAVGKVGKYARSGADLAAAAGVPAIPIAHNAGLVWPSKGFLIYPGTIKIAIGKPIDTQSQSSKSVIQQLQSWIENEIAGFEAGNSRDDEKKIALAN